jgi:hypothetical protein
MPDIEFIRGEIERTPLSWHSADVASLLRQGIDVADDVRNLLGSPTVTVGAISRS